MSSRRKHPQLGGSRQPMHNGRTRPKADSGVAREGDFVGRFIISCEICFVINRGYIVTKMIQNFRTWLPALFSAFVVYITMRQSDRLSSVEQISIWLPMCFFFVSAVSYLLQKQIRELQAEVKELQRLATKSAP